MVEILELRHDAPPEARACAVEVLEAGGLVLLPQASFELSDAEQGLLDPGVVGKSKNVSLDPNTGAVSGAAVEGDRVAALGGMVRRFSERAEALLCDLAPRYASALQKRRTSFRPGAVAKRVLSPRKDDRRLHVDAFPANPVQGRRILRVFSNVNPAGQARVWNLGEEDFATFAARFAKRLPARAAPSWLLERVGVTKGRRSAYDQAMLDLHDLAKLDEAYQQSAPKRRIEFAPGSTWIVFTDSVLHAALSGQHAFEQTFLLPVEAMREPERSPLRVLEALTGRALV